MALPSPFQALPVNLLGTDYFVGDIHGAFDKLQLELGMKGFRPDVDRLISVGDLIDRGRGSVKAEQWLGLPYFYAVRGNHEELYLEWRRLAHQRDAQERFEQETYFPNGGKWVAEVSELDHVALEALLAQLPYLITVPSVDGHLVAAVHAGLPDGSSWPQMINTPLTTGMLNDMLWSRNRMKFHRGVKEAFPVWDDGVIPGLHAVVCGHVVVPRPTWVGQFLYLETAGWRQGGRFSIMSLPAIVRKKH